MMMMMMMLWVVVSWIYSLSVVVTTALFIISYKLLAIALAVHCINSLIIHCILTVVDSDSRAGWQFINRTDLKDSMNMYF